MRKKFLILHKSIQCMEKALKDLLRSGWNEDLDDFSHGVRGGICPWPAEPDNDSLDGHKSGDEESSFGSDLETVKEPLSTVEV